MVNRLAELLEKAFLVWFSQLFENKVMSVYRLSLAKVFGFQISLERHFTDY